MHASEVIKSINAIYDAFRIPQNLRMHMKRVAAVGAIICDNWSGTEIRKDNIKAVLLIHDLGNVVKFTLDPGNAHMLYPGQDLAALRKLRAETIAKYGADEYQATGSMAKEIGIDKELQSLLEAMCKYEGTKISKSKEEDYEVRICTYSDMRVSPYSVVSAEDRIRDLINRYKGRGEKEAIFREMLEIAPRLEGELFRNISITPDQITEESVKPYIEEFG